MMENSNASMKYSHEYKAPKVQTKRERLFWIQTLILAGLVVIAGLTFIGHNQLNISKGIKLVFAPFLSVVPLIFIFTMVREWVRIFSDRVFSQKEVLYYTMLTLFIAALSAFLTWIVDGISDMEVLIAVIFAVLSVVSFIGLKVKDILGISILTGISEGLIIYMVFLF